MKRALVLTICFILSLDGLPAQIRPDRNPAGIGTQQRPRRRPGEFEIPAELKVRLKITEAEKKEFKEILKNSKGKLAKIWNSPCKPEIVINVQDTPCIENFNFILASSIVFSDGFGFAGVTLIKGEFLGGRYGPITSILVDLGEVDFSLINKQSNEVKSLKGIHLAYNFQNRKMETIPGMSEFQGLKISHTQPSKLNHTYLLRSAMYSKNFIYTDNSQIIRDEIKENIYAFKVVKEKDNLVTILWKKIESKQKFV